MAPVGTVPRLYRLLSRSVYILSTATCLRFRWTSKCGPGRCSVSSSAFLRFLASTGPPRRSPVVANLIDRSRLDGSDWAASQGQIPKRLTPGPNRLKLLSPAVVESCTKTVADRPTGPRLETTATPPEFRGCLDLETPAPRAPRSAANAYPRTFKSEGPAAGHPTTRPH